MVETLILISGIKNITMRFYTNAHHGKIKKIGNNVDYTAHVYEEFP